MSYRMFQKWLRGWVRLMPEKVRIGPDTEAETPTLPLFTSVALDMSFYFLEPASSSTKWAE